MFVQLFFTAPLTLLGSWLTLSLISGNPNDKLFSSDATCATVLVFIALGMMLLHLKIRSYNLQQAADFSPKIRPIAISAVMTIGILVSSYLALSALAPQSLHLSFSQRSLLIGFAVAFYSSISEEVICRAIILRSIWKRHGVPLAVVITSTLFGFVHVLNPNANWLLGFFIAVGAGTFLSILYIGFNNIYASIVAHFIWNFLVLSSGNVLSGMSLVHVSKLDAAVPILLSGGEFGLEGSILTTAIFFACNLILWFKYRLHRMAAPVDTVQDLPAQT